MPRREISLEEAFAAFEKRGLKVEVMTVEPVTPPQPDPIVDRPRAADTYSNRKSVKVGESLVRVTLHARHIIGSGGSMVGEGKSATVTGNTSQTYGPGVCYVKPDLASDLLYRDQEAKRADERFLDKTARTFIVTTVRDNMGILRNVPVEVTSDDYSSHVSPYDGGSSNQSLGRL
jgi:hypothetical protein